MSTLDGNSTVAEWVSENPQTAQVFEELQVDYCCGGGRSLSQACENKQLDCNSIIVRLTQVVADPRHEPSDNWLESPLTPLCDHIEKTHHAFLREHLPRLSGLIAKVVTAHGMKHAELVELQSVFAELRGELEPHMLKEEQVLFPAIRQLDQTASRPKFPFGTVANPIRMMEHEHDTAGNAMSRIHHITNNFEPPRDACNTYRVMLDTLKRLELDLHQHIHKENFVLFPRAQELEENLSVSHV